ncbi:MAG TPA: hypothetical protein VIT91_21270 [Chthoniobacterales bacterium]
MIQANCRSRFTAEDFSFIVRVLSTSPSNEISLVDLLSDVETRDVILDHDRLRDVVLTDARNLSISPHLYFYILSRAVLKETVLNDRAVSDYVASLLVAFSSARQMQSPVGADEPRSRVYLTDLLLALRQANDQQTFLIRAHLGNYSLFISGILHENVRRRQLRGAPDVSFYEEVGSQSYKVAAEHNVAKRCDLSAVFHDLGDRFHEVRLALNRMVDQFIHLGDDPHLPVFSA